MLDLSAASHIHSLPLTVRIPPSIAHDLPQRKERAAQPDHVRPKTLIAPPLRASAQRQPRRTYSQELAHVHETAIVEYLLACSTALAAMHRRTIAILCISRAADDIDRVCATVQTARTRLSSLTILTQAQRALGLRPRSDDESPPHG